MTVTGPVYADGPEVWRADAGVEWSYWDLWLALLCVRDHGGDWDGLDAAITELRRFDGEAKWSHLLDLRKRLEVAGLSLAEAAALLETGDEPETVAVRRAMLTIGLDLMECCDDSYGALGDVVGQALEVYAGTDWRSAGVRSEVFWPDFLEIVTMLANYGVVDRREAELFRLTGVARDLDTVCEIAAASHEDYVAARMGWHADEVQTLQIHAVAAAGALDRFETTVRRIGPTSRVACEAMVQVALESGRIVRDDQPRLGRQHPVPTRMSWSGWPGRSPRPGCSRRVHDTSAHGAPMRSSSSLRSWSAVARTSRSQRCA